jgi:hypothetical protein
MRDIFTWHKLPLDSVVFTNLKNRISFMIEADFGRIVRKTGFEIAHRPISKNHNTTP